MGPHRGKKVTLKHGEIKGLMPAMTMEFPVKSIEMLEACGRGIKSGSHSVL